MSDFIDQDDNGSAKGFRADTHGYILGVDRGFGGDLVAGLALGGTVSDVRGGNRQTADLNTFFATGYGSYVVNGWTISANFGIASSDYAIKRRVFTLESESKLQGDSMYIGAELSRMFRVGRFDLVPYVALNSIAVTVEDFKDASFDGADGMTIDSGTSSSLPATLGVRLLGRSRTGKQGAVWTPAFALAWHHDFCDDPLYSKTTFAGSAPLSVIGAKREQDRIQTGISTNISMRNLSIFAAYDFEFSSRFCASTLQGGLNIAF